MCRLFCSSLLLATICIKYAQCAPQGITLSYKPNRPFYAMGWTNRPNQIHPPGTPWPASAEGYTSTTTGKPWWATPAQEVVPNAVSISTQGPVTTTTIQPPPPSRPTSAAPPASRPTSPAPPPSRPTAPSRPPMTSTLPSVGNKVDVSSTTGVPVVTIATKVPPVPASTEATLFTSAPEGDGGPQGPPKGSWSGRPKPTTVAPNLPSRMNGDMAIVAATPPIPVPNNLTLLPDPLSNNPQPEVQQSSSTSSTTFKVVSTSTSAPLSSSSAAASTVIENRPTDGSLNLNSRFSRPEALVPPQYPIWRESQEAPESAWVWEFHQGDGKTWSGEFYDSSAISLDFK